MRRTTAKNGTYGAYDYSFGYRNPSGTWRTVMAYAPGTRLMYFSNPSVLYDGEPMGIPASQADSANNALALRSSDGSTSWHSGIGRVGNSPITYELDGRQFVLFGGGTALYAFALP